MHASAQLAGPEPILGPRPVPADDPRIGAFTRYVEALVRHREPELERFDEMWRALRAALVRELQRRSLWLASPSFLGVYGWESWQAGDGEGGAGSPLEELLADCYAFIFLQRLPRLEAQLALKPNIDGFVFLYLRNYVHDRQKHHDPLGFRIFKVLRAAIRQAVEAGELRVVAGDAKIDNSTVLAVDVAQATAADAARCDELEPLAGRWNDELLPDLVTAGGTAYARMLDALRRRFLDLEAAGVMSVRFKDLADAVKSDVRSRWAALWDQTEGEALPDPAEVGDGGGVPVRLVEPGSRFEDLQSFVSLVGCVSEALERFDGPPRAHHYLLTLWGFLRTFAAGDDSEALPSNRRLASLLRIPRERFPELWQTLHGSIRACQEALAGASASESVGRSR